MNVVFLTYTRKGCEVIRTIRPFFRQAECRSYSMERFGERNFLSVSSSEHFYKELFCWADVMVFVCSSGIAVRLIAPFLKNKCSDPAVICIDDRARFVISLLAGHIGGANRIATRLAEFLHAVPVITTATDGNEKFAVDAWAAENHCVIDSMENAKAVSAEILDCDVPLVCDFSIRGGLPSGVKFGNEGTVGICISCFKRNPFQKTLRLIPKILHLGIGCRRGTPYERICEAVETVLSRYQIDERALNRVATVDLKSNEEGLLEYCSKKNLLFRFYSAEELKKIAGTFTSSPFVFDVTGVDNICERAAMHEAEKLLVKKNIVNGVTVAVAAEPWEVCFE